MSWGPAMTDPGNTGRPPGSRRASRGGGPRLAVRCREARADVHLRIAWLRVTADLMYEVDRSGLLSAQLLDLAHLLEALDRDGRVSWW